MTGWRRDDFGAFAARKKALKVSVDKPILTSDMTLNVKQKIDYTHSDR